MIPYKMTIRFSKPPDVSIRAWRQGMREAHAAQGRVWDTEMLPDHFKPYARFKYQHKPRGGDYLNNKRRALLSPPQGPLRNKHIDPLAATVDNVLTGNTKRALLAGARIRAFPTRARLDYAVPFYVTMRPYKSNQPDKWAELSRVTPDQMRRLDHVLRTEVLARFKNAPEQPLTIRIAA